MAGTGDASAARADGWKVHALFWSQIQAGPLANNCMECSFLAYLLHGRWQTCWWFSVFACFFWPERPGVALQRRVRGLWEGRCFADAHCLLARTGPVCIQTYVYKVSKRLSRLFWCFYLEFVQVGSFSILFGLTSCWDRPCTLCIQLFFIGPEDLRAAQDRGGQVWAFGWTLSFEFIWQWVKTKGISWEWLAIKSLPYGLVFWNAFWVLVGVPKNLSLIWIMEEFVKDMCFWFPWAKSDKAKARLLSWHSKAGFDVAQKMLEQGGHFYVCGSARQVPEDIYTAMKEAGEMFWSFSKMQKWVGAHTMAMGCHGSKPKAL